jgi:allantoinase
MRIITSQRIVCDDGIKPGGLVVRDGKIVEIVSEGQFSTKDHVEDYGNHVIMPGLIDVHVHLNEPGREDWEGFESGTKAAAAGGITTVIDMPLNSNPVTTTTSALENKANASNGKLSVDCGFYAGLIPGNEHQIEALLEAGVFGVKAFLCPSGLDDFPPVTRHELETIMPLLCAFDRPLLVHAEQINDHNIPKRPPQTYKEFAETRPESWEIEAISMLIDLCRETRCRVHIVHLASAEAAKLVEKAKIEGLPITAETAPHYLYFEAESLENGNPRFKCAPPIRGRNNRLGLWNALRNGIIDFVATDHSPTVRDLKFPATGNFDDVWGGISSLQLMLPAVWTAGRERGASLKSITRWCSSAPAKFLGLDSTIGKIAPGFDANLVVWDPEAQFTVDEHKLLHKQPISAYHGQQLYGVVKATYLRGEQIYNGSEVTNATLGRQLLSKMAKQV